ncbi:hypothetical protein B566_EDAN003171 [Ephemera danica]|nr:hypothetical protein B566_EDAN003171 [Ephemera danica]
MVRAGVGLDLLARRIKQRAQDGQPALTPLDRNGCCADHAGTAKQVEEQGLRLVATVMAQQQRVHIEIGEGAVAHRPGCRLDALPTSAVDHDVGNIERDTDPGTEFGAKGAPGVCIGGQSVMNVDCPQRAVPGQMRNDVQQHHRVAAAGQANGQAGAGLAAVGQKGADPPPLVSRRKQFCGGHAGQVFERILQRFLERLCHGRIVAVRTAERFADNPVDQTQCLQALGGDAHGLGRFGRLVGTLPENGSAALRGNDRVGRILEHLHDVADSNGQRPSGTALADDGDDDRHLELGHDVEVAADGLGLATLLGTDSGIGARRVDEGHHRQTKLFGQLHQAQGLPVAFGTRHAEVAKNFLLGITTLLVPDNHDRVPIEARQAANDGMVVGEGAVAMEFFEVAEQQGEIVERVRTLRVAGDLGYLPGRQLRVDTLGQLGALLFETADLLGDVDSGVVLNKAQLFNFGFELGNRLLEVEKTCFHGQPAYWVGAYFNLETSVGRGGWCARPSAPAGEWHRRCPCLHSCECLGMGKRSMRVSRFSPKGIQAAPQVPGCYRAPRTPPFAERCEHLARLLFPGEVAFANCPLQPEIVKGENIRAQLVEDQEHLGGPPANAANTAQQINQCLVVEREPAGGIKAARREVCRQVENVFDLAPRQPATSQAGLACRQQGLWRDARHGGRKTLPDGFCGLDRNLLTDN